MLTINHLLEKDYSIDHVLTDLDKAILLEENKDANFSYLCLMKEMFSYSHITVDSLLQGWGGVQLVKL